MILIFGNREAEQAALFDGGEGGRVCAVEHPGLDPSIPNVARMHSYLLGGTENFQADRDAAERLLKIVPEARQAALDTREFLRRAVRYLSEQGIGQFLDIGTGMPAKDNTHDIAHEVNPEARVVYVDRDPVAVSHGNAFLAKSQQVVVVAADVRRPEELLGLPAVQGHLDFAEPVGLILLQVMNFVSDADGPAAIAATLKDALCPGSYLVLGHITGDNAPERLVATAAAAYAAASDNPRPRGRDQVLGLFDGFTLVEPGLVPVHAWRPEPGAPSRPDTTMIWVGVARK